MIRGFLSGVFWGTAVAALGLGAASQLTPLPVARIAADASAVQVAKPAPADPVVVAKTAVPTEVPVAEVAPAKVPVVTPAPAVVPVVKPMPVVPVVPATTAVPADAPVAEVAPAKVPVVAAAPAAVPIVKPVLDAAGQPVAPATEQSDPPAGSEFAKPLPDVAPVLPREDAPVASNASAVAPLTPPASDTATVTDQPSVAPKTGLEPPKPLVTPNDTQIAADLPAGGDAAKTLPVVPDQPALPQADIAPPAAESVAPAAPAAPAEPLLKPLPKVLPVPDTKPETPVQLTPDAPLVPATDPAAGLGTKETATLAPTPGLKGTVDGVKIGRLPQIDSPKPAVEGEAAAAAVPDPNADQTLAIGGDVEVPPLKKYARTFENPDAKPLFSIILIDTGGPDVDRAALAALPFPVSFVLDPMAAGAAAASKIYRDAGQEVVMVATGIPPGATASDLEVTFQANASALPEAVAVIDTEIGAFQANRVLATQVIPILKAQGRGLISWDRGLNAADQVAKHEGLAAGTVFRKLDGKGEDTAAVRRALDRAAFKAAQDGRVIVIGQTQPETIKALTEWAAAARAASVALAPVSAALTTQ